MKARIPIFFFLVSLVISSQAQVRTIVFEYERSVFDGGNPLPSGQLFFINGQVGPDIHLVEIELYKPSFDKKLYTANWKRPFNSQSDMFQALFKFKLKSSSTYDLKINYYRYVTIQEYQKLGTLLENALHAYLDQSIQQSNDRRLMFSSSPDRMLAAMNQIVNNGLTLYRSKNQIEFPGFSDIIRVRLKDLEDSRLKRAKYSSDEKDPEKAQAVRAAYIKKRKEELMVLVQTELRQYINSDLLVLNDSKLIDAYPTERSLNPIAINLGYGGVYLEGSFNDLEYDDGAYLGISLPFANARSDATFWRNTALSAGVFLQNFEDVDGETLSGPIVGRPYYVGLGYRAFRFIRINAGITALERTGANASSDLQLSPFLGVSAEIGLWLGINR
ncbi:MAG: hypothetical protein AAGI38_02090 [Bacteroidota bacterium]